MDRLIDDSDRLKPCPFCGGEAMFTVELREGHPDFGGHAAMCGTCGAGVGYVFACGDDPQPLLAEQWNKRVTSTEAAERELAEARAKIDALMLEYCPDEMTPGQVDEWARHQRPIDAERGKR